MKIFYLGCFLFMFVAFLGQTQVYSYKGCCVSKAKDGEPGRYHFFEDGEDGANGQNGGHGGDGGGSFFGRGGNGGNGGDVD